MPVDKWHALIGDPTLGDAILDRLVHNACMRPAKSSIEPRRAKTWCALKFKWAPVLAF